MQEEAVSEAGARASPRVCRELTMSPKSRQMISAAILLAQALATACHSGARLPAREEPECPVSICANDRLRQIWEESSEEERRGWLQRIECEIRAREGGVCEWVSDGCLHSVQGKNIRVFALDGGSTEGCGFPIAGGLGIADDKGMLFAPTLDAGNR